MFILLNASQGYLTSSYSNLCWVHLARAYMTCPTKQNFRISNCYSGQHFATSYIDKGFKRHLAAALLLFTADVAEHKDCFSFALRNLFESMENPFHPSSFTQNNPFCIFPNSCHTYCLKNKDWVLQPVSMKYHFF